MSWEKSDVAALLVETVCFKPHSKLPIYWAEKSLLGIYIRSEIHISGKRRHKTNISSLNKLSGNTSTFDDYFEAMKVFAQI